jgi:hypothetical protein
MMGADREQQDDGDRYPDEPQQDRTHSFASSFVSRPANNNERKLERFRYEASLTGRRCSACERLMPVKYSLAR